MDFTERYPDSSSSVALAVRRDDVDSLRRLVERGKSLETRDNRGYRPIHEAAHWSQDDCLKLLLESNADLQVDVKTFEGQTALWLAADNNSFETAKILIDAGALVNLPNNEDVTPLHCCSSKGFKEIAALLLQNGANPNMKDFNGFTPLHEAAVSNKFSVVELLLLNGADKTIQEDHNRTALFCACESDSCQSVNLLLEQSSPGFVNARASDGATALMVSAQKGCLECVKLLITYGADPNLRADDQVMAVHLAINKNQEELLRFLVQITDHRLIEQSCGRIDGNQLVKFSNLDSFRDELNGQNIFKMSIINNRLHLLKVLVEEELEADRFPCLPDRSDALFGKKHFITPLGYILAFGSPFHEDSLECVRYLIESGCCVTALQPEYNSVITCLLYGMKAANWSDNHQSSLFFQALELLILKGALLNMTIAERYHFLFDALSSRPDVFLSVIHKGYIFDSASCRDTCHDIVLRMKRFNQFPEEEIIHESFYRMICEILSSGMCTDRSVFEGFPEHKIPSLGYDKFLQLIKHQSSSALSLKKLCRKTIHSVLLRCQFNIPIPNLALPIPQTLVDYLCYRDVQL